MKYKAFQKIRHRTSSKFNKKIGNTKWCFPMQYDDVKQIQDAILKIVFWQYLCSIGRLMQTLAGTEIKNHMQIQVM